MELKEYLSKCTLVQKEKLESIFDWMLKEFPELHIEMKWNQPMFVLDKTFIISYSYASKHISAAPEKVILDKFSDKIKKAGYTHSKMLMKITNEQEVNFELLKEIVTACMDLKRGMDKFWY